MDKKILVFTFLLSLLLISGFAVANSGQLEPSSKFFDFDKNSDGTFAQNDIDYWIGGYKYQVLNAKNLLYIVDKIPQNGIYSCDESNIETCLKMPLYTNNEDSAQARSLFILNAFETTPALRVFSQDSSNKLSPSKKEFSVTGSVINNIVNPVDSEKTSIFSDRVVKGNLKGITGSFSAPSGNPGYRPPPPKPDCGNGQCEDGESVGSCASDCTPTIPPIILPVLCQGVICPAYSIPNNPNLVCTSIATYGGCCIGLYCVGDNPDIDEPPIGDEDLDDNEVPDDFPEVEDEDIIEIACGTGIGAEIVSEDSLLQQVTQGLPTGISGNAITGNAIVGICGDGKCTTASGESATNCPKDCGQVMAGGAGVPSSRGVDYQAWCGNGVVDLGEQCDVNVPGGKINGDVCVPDFGKSCSYCSSSCRFEYVANNCGDGVCNYGETYSSCSNDCQNPSITDSDGDGIFNNFDTDDDNDGVNDGEDLDDLNSEDTSQNIDDASKNQDYSLDLDPNKQNEECSGDDDIKEPVECKAISCAMPPISVTSQYTDAVCVRDSLELDADGCPLCGGITCEDGTIIPPEVIIPVCDTLIQCRPAYEECSYPSQAYDNNGCMVGCGPMVCENSTIINETLIISYQWKLIEIAGASPTANINPNVGSSYGLGSTANIHLEGMFAQSNLQAPSSSSVTGNAVAGITGNVITGYQTAGSVSIGQQQHDLYVSTVYDAQLVAMGDKYAAMKKMYADILGRDDMGGAYYWANGSESLAEAKAAMMSTKEYALVDAYRTVLGKDMTKRSAQDEAELQILYNSGKTIDQIKQEMNSNPSQFRAGTPSLVTSVAPPPVTPPTSPTCGNNVCDAGEAGSCTPGITGACRLGTCPADCPAPPVSGVVCGDNSCDAGEDATNCASDCSGNICISGNIIIKLPTTAVDGQTVTYTDPNGVTITFIAKVIAKTIVTTTTTTIGGGGGTVTTTTTTGGGGGGSGGGGTTGTGGGGGGTTVPSADVCGDGKCTGNENLLICSQAPSTIGGGGAGQICNKRCAVDCGGTTTTSGVTCPVAPSCPMPQPGCGYTNPTRDANNCITGCGNPVCTPPAPVCGNAIVEAPETCDAGNQNGLTCTISAGQNYCDYCSTSCLIVRNTAIVIVPYVPPTSDVCTPAKNGCFVCMQGDSSGFDADCRAQGGTPSCNGGACNCFNVPGCQFINGGIFGGTRADGTTYAGTPQCNNRCSLGSTTTTANPTTSIAQGSVTGSVISGNAVKGITGNAIGITGNVVGSPHNLVIESPFGVPSEYYIKEPSEIRARFDKIGAEISKYPIFSIEYTVFGNNWASRGEIWNNKPANDPSKANLVGNYNYNSNSNTGIITVPFPDLPRKGRYTVIVQVTQVDYVKGNYPSTYASIEVNYDPITLNAGEPIQGQKISALPFNVYAQLSSDIGTYSHAVKYSFDGGKTNNSLSKGNIGSYSAVVGQMSKTGTIPLSIFVDVNGGSSSGQKKAFQSTFSYDPSTSIGSTGIFSGPSGGSSSAGCYYNKGGPWVHLSVGGSSLGGDGTGMYRGSGLSFINAQVGDTLSLETTYHSGGSMPNGFVTITSPSGLASKVKSYNQIWGSTNSFQDIWSIKVTGPGTFTVNHPAFPGCNWVFNVFVPTTTGTGGGSGFGGGGGVNVGQCVASGGKWDSINGVCIIGGGGTGTGGGTTGTGGGSVTVGTTPVCTLGNADCGNGLREPGEICDAGSANGQVCNPQYGSSCNYCTSSCTSISVTGPSCGDGIVQRSTNTNVVPYYEDCDLGSQNGLVGPESGNCRYCSNSCGCVTNNIGPRCGDLVCNNGESYLSCPSDCTNVPSSCGNSIVETGESCDLGTANNGLVCTPNYGQVCNYCDVSCQSGIVPAPSCGDRICQSTNENSVSCAIDCPVFGPVCGNGMIEPGEQCDTASSAPINGFNSCSLSPAPYDGSCYTCSAGCLYNNVRGPSCGDRICQANYETATSCVLDCGVVAGFCGNGVLNSGEACDDGANNKLTCTPTYSFSSSSIGSCTYCVTNLCNLNTVPGPFCGDGVCSPEHGENYQTCGPNQPLAQRDCIEDTTPPICPSTSRVVITNQTSATLQWAGDAQDNPGGSGLAGILLYRFNILAQTNSVTTITNPTYLVNGVSFVDNLGLTAGNSYYYRFGVKDVAGNIAICNPLLTLNANTTTVPVVVPFTMSIDSPTAGQILNTSTVNFIVSLSQLGGSVKYSLNNGSSNLSMSANGQVFTSLNTGMINGIYTMTAYAQNASGFNLTATRQFSVVIASAIAGVSIDLATGWNYFSVPESSSAVVGSSGSIGASGFTTADKELDLSLGWNLIGYSGVNDVPQTNLEFKGASDTSYKDLNTAAREKRIQKRFVEYLAENQKFDYSTNTVTEEGKAYWVYGREAGKLKAPAVNSPIVKGKPVKVQDIEFQNETSGEIKLLVNALSSGWIGQSTQQNPSDVVSIWYRNQYQTVPITQDLQNWKGYVIYTNNKDIKMIVPNA